MQKTGIVNLSTTWIDYPDNESLAVAVYFSGCLHNCINCQNRDLAEHQPKEFNYLEAIEKKLKQNRTDKLVLSGGDPLFPLNLEATKNILNHFQDKSICIYTGYTIDYVKENQIKNFTFIKCGKYLISEQQISEKTNDYLKFASKNQELYNSDYKLLSQDGIFYFKGQL